MTIDNEMYSRECFRWWDDDADSNSVLLRYFINPVRFSYFVEILRQKSGGDTSKRILLDVGCGGGYLSEEFAKMGFEVTGIDPSQNTIRAAGTHAAQGNLRIDYEEGRAEAIPISDASCDYVCCCDVLEHVDSVEQAIGEAARVLKPGGAFLFDTVNRTRRSNLVLIKIWQDWGVGGFSAKHAHVWDKFIRPGELRAAMHARGLAAVEMKGMSPGRNPLAMLHALWKIRRGAIRNGAVATAFPLRESGDLSVSYMGWARKA